MPQTSNRKPQTTFYTLRRPLVGIALAVALGMMIGSSGLFSFSMLLITALVCIVLGGLLIRTGASIALVFCGVALMAACRFTVAVSPLSNAEINRLQPQLPLENVQLIGRVTEPPEYHAYRSGDLGIWIVPLDCEGLKCRIRPRPSNSSSVAPHRGREGGARTNGLVDTHNTSPTTINQTGRDGSPSRPHAHSAGLPGSEEDSVRLARRSSPAFPPTTNNPSTINQPAWRAKRGRIQVRVTSAPPDELFRQGARIRFSGTLRRRAFPGGEPVELVVPADGSAKKNPSIQYPVSSFETLSPPPRFSPVLWGQRLRMAAARTLSNGIENHPAQLAVYKALLLGYRKAVPHEIYRKFKHTGTLHIFAISGLHVGIVGLLITVVLKTVGIPRDRWGFFLLPLLLGYVMATGMKSSALRALAMAAVFFLAPLFRRKPDIPVSIAFAGILLLFWKPLEILSPGFIFSFTVVSFIVMLFSRIPKAFIFRGAGWGRAVRAYMLSLSITSAAAFIASTPLTALFFGSFSPVSLAGNLAVVPLTFCIVLSGWLSILVPPASEIFNHAALVFINALLGTTGLLARLPGAYVQVPAPPLTALLFWYGGWIHLLVHARNRRQRTASSVLITLAVVLTLL